MPNASGTKGVPKYVKQLDGSPEAVNGTYFNGDWCESADDKDATSPDDNAQNENRTGNLVLSASAAEFKPKIETAVAVLGTNGKVSYAAAASKIANTA